MLASEISSNEELWVGCMSGEKIKLMLPAAFALVFWVSPVDAQSRIDAERTQNADIEWVVFTGINSASLARQGADLIASTGFDGVDGGENNKAVITFWKPTLEPYIWADLVRCIDYFDGLMQAAGSACSIPKSQE